MQRQREFVCDCIIPVPSNLSSIYWTGWEEHVLVFCYFQVLFFNGGAVRDWDTLTQYYNHAVIELSMHQYPCRCGEYRSRTTVALRRHLRAMRNRGEDFENIYAVVDGTVPVSSFRFYERHFQL